MKQRGEEPDGNGLSTAKKRLSPARKENQDTDEDQRRKPAEQASRVCELTRQHLAGQKPHVEQRQNGARAGEDATKHRLSICLSSAAAETDAGRRRWAHQPSRVGLTIVPRTRLRQ